MKRGRIVYMIKASRFITVVLLLRPSSSLYQHNYSYYNDNDLVLVIHGYPADGNLGQTFISTLKDLNHDQCFVNLISFTLELWLNCQYLYFLQLKWFDVSRPVIRYGSFFFEVASKLGSHDIIYIRLSTNKRQMISFVRIIW